MKRVHIVAAIIFNCDKSEIFITKRADDKHQGGLWEFPGGKVEAGESEQQALSRELHEEIGITVTQCQAFEAFAHDYPDKSLQFAFYTVSDFQGQPYGKEGQQGQWVAVTQLKAFAFPAANIPVLEKVVSQYQR
ncbi:8-oxo-dGTP diphosphatase MutT [Vibrio profundum]|uniref:8-oxo-dGTP diphosphatase MutT n=1 Tax=Vibrio profundum TaxID=2910247 RepID=UPI003D0D42EF